MTAREIFTKETGHEEPSNPMLHAEWKLKFYDWLEKQVENGQKTKGKPESFEDTTLKDFLKMMENLDRFSSVCFYSDGSGDVVNNENNSELCFDNLEELGELLRPKIQGKLILKGFNKVNKKYVFISDEETERAVLIDHVTKLEPQQPLNCK